MLKTCKKLFRGTCEFMKMLISKITCYCQIISALNSWITFNKHHQNSNMGIIIQIMTLRARTNFKTDRCLHNFQEHLFGLLRLRKYQTSLQNFFTT